MRAAVDPNVCIGCELCTNICPDVFQMTPEGKSHAIVNPVPPPFQEAARDAASSCPVSAITLSD